MKKITIRCWKDEVVGEDGERVEIFLTISDFYEAFRLHIHPPCGALFAIDPEVEHYQKKDFELLKSQLNCPVCQNILRDVMPYPDNFRFPVSGRLSRYNRTPNAAPSNREEYIVEFWNPLD